MSRPSRRTGIPQDIVARTGRTQERVSEKQHMIRKGAVQPSRGGVCQSIPENMERVGSNDNENGVRYALRLGSYPLERSRDARSLSSLITFHRR